MRGKTNFSLVAVWSLFSGDFSVIVARDLRFSDRLAASLQAQFKALALVVVTFLLMLPASLFAQSNDYVPGELIVKLKGKKATLEGQAFIGKAVSEKGMVLKGSLAGLNTHFFALKTGQSVESAIADLKSDPAVEYAEPNYIIRRQSFDREGSAVAMSEVQAAAASASGTVGSFAQTNAPVHFSDAWSALSPNADPIIVAVIDTGVDYTHTVFTQTGAIWSNTKEIPDNGIDDDNNGYVDDVRGWNFVDGNNKPMDDDDHGTHVAGIVLGATQDITSANLQPAKVRIMPLKFLDSSGAGATSDAIKAIYYAVNNGARVLNNSWGGGGFSNSLLTAIAYAYDHHVAFVAAAGNSTNNNDANPTYPANYSVPNIISVAATSDYDYLASFSNYGAQTVHMASPGVSIWSTLPTQSYGRLSGTSMAAPFVSGIAALALRESPTMNPYQLRNLIFQSSTLVSSLNSKTITKSRLNASTTVLAAKSAAVDSSQPAYDLNAARSPASETAEGSSGSGGGSSVGCGLVKAIGEGEGGGGPVGAGQVLSLLGILVALAVPLALGLYYRKQDDGRNRRQHDRYVIQSDVKLKIGDSEMIGKVSSISMGGVQLDTAALLEQGGIVKMSIRSPDGQDQIEVEGQVVWSEAQKSYGVAFSNADEPVRSAISKWTQGLLKT